MTSSILNKLEIAKRRLITGFALSLSCICIAAATQASATQIKVMTYNIHDIVGQSAGYNSDYAQRIARIANYYQPDVLTINELEGNSLTYSTENLKNWVKYFLPYFDGPDANTVSDPDIEFFYYVSAISDGYNRNAIISRYPMPVASRGYYSLSPRDLLYATIDLPGELDVRVYTAHFKAGSDSYDASVRQSNANTTSMWITTWSGYIENSNTPYLMCGDLNEDEDNPQYPLSGSYHPISTVREAYLQNYRPTDGWGDDDTISSTSPSRRFDYILPSWHLEVVPQQAPSVKDNSIICNTNIWFLHAALPAGMYRWDCFGTDHLGVLGTFEVLDNNIQNYKTLSDGKKATLTGKAVTASYSDHFYLQDAQYGAGIRINSTTSPAVGSVVNVTGTLCGAYGERAINASGVRILNSTGGNIEPLAMSNKAVGGCDIESIAPGVENSYGPNNMGTLVKIAGKVDSKVSGSVFLDDGSGYTVKVYSTTAINVGDFVSAVGVVGYEKPAGHAASIRVIKTRSSGDVRVIKSAN